MTGALYKHIINYVFANCRGRLLGCLSDWSPPQLQADTSNSQSVAPIRSARLLYCAWLSDKGKWESLLGLLLRLGHIRTF